jgi:hypothetical protein
MDQGVDLVEVLVCRPTLPVYQCNDCLQWTVTPQDCCHYCTSQCINREWRMDYEIHDIETSTYAFFPRSPTVSAMGTMLDLVMGMTIDDYLFLVSKYGDLSDLVRRYFERSRFQVIRIDVKLASIFLPPGNQLTFRKWLGLQPPFDELDLETELRDSLWEMNELEGEVPPGEVNLGNFLSSLSM